MTLQIKFLKLINPQQHLFVNDTRVSLSKVKSMLTFLILIGIAIFTSSLIPAENLALNKIPIRHYVSFEKINTPDTDVPMGFLGLYYLVDITSWFNAGMVSYSAISGNQGGLFTLGLISSTRLPISQKLMLDAGLSFGGGGGNLWTGNGSLWRYHSGILYQFERFNLGVYISQVTFPDSKISGNQLGLAVELPSSILIARPTNINHTETKLPIIINGNDIHIRFSQNQFSLIQQNYIQKTGTASIDGTPQDEIIRLVGFEIMHSLRPGLFLLLKTAGALGGIRHGYMDIMAGAGFSKTIPGRGINYYSKLSVGAGGGARVETAGGLLLDLRVGLGFKILPNLSLDLAGGYLGSQSGNLQALTTTSMISYHLKNAGLSEYPVLESKNSIYIYKAWAVRIFDQVYKNPKRLNLKVNDNVRLLGIKFDHLLTQWVYISGQGMFAYSGENVGGLAVGLLGIGLQHPPIFNKHIKLHLELAGGAAGGGHLALGEGAIFQPSTGITFYLNQYLGIQYSIGQIRALGHELKTSVYDISLTLNFTTLTK